MEKSLKSKKIRTQTRIKKAPVSQKRKAIIPSSIKSRTTKFDFGNRVLNELLDGEKQVPSVSNYEFVREIGEGAQGAVFLGHQLSEFGIKKRIAIKVFKDDYGDKEIKKIVREAKLLEMLTQGSVVEMLALESLPISRKGDKKVYLLIEELIDGQSLEKFMILHKRKNLLMNPALIGFTLYRAALALDEAHNLTNKKGKKLNLVHRSLSPSNILYNDKGGIVKLSDFGMAIMDDASLSADILKGKPQYMAPEQFQAKNLSCSDVWALGVIGYEALTGFSPYQIKGKSLSDAISMFIEQSHFTLRSPAEILASSKSHFNLNKLSDIIMSCLNINGHKRPTADELQHMLASEFLYSSGLGPTNKTMAAYLSLLQEMPAQDDFVISDIKMNEAVTNTLNRTLHIKKPISAICARVSKSFKHDFLVSIKEKHKNPCLKPDNGKVYGA